jgi:hypothetical protein
MLNTKVDFGCSYRLQKFEQSVASEADYIFAMVLQMDF